MYIKSSKKVLYKKIIYKKAHLLGLMNILDDKQCFIKMHSLFKYDLENGLKNGLQKWSKWYIFL